ncbi:MAG TPA: hypothetical protein VLI04_18390 [Nocardioidaceae bacterium]|nr:hypothetical protein [Nocardioidaceae bacterium]
MSVAISPETSPSATTPSRTAGRVAAVASALLGVALFWTVASMNVPHDATDAELLTWWQDSGNRMTGVVSGLFAILTAIAIAVVANHLADLSAARRTPQWLALSRSMAAAVTAVWLVTGAARGSIGHLVDFMDEPLPGLDTLRSMTAFNYMLLGTSGMAVLGLFIVAVSVVVLRSGALGRWVSYVGLGCGVVMVAAVLARYGAFTTPLAILWSFCLAFALWREPAGRS